MLRGCGTILLVFFTYAAVAQQSNATVSLAVNNVPLEQILDSISAQTGFFFSYNSTIVPAGSLYTIESQDNRLTRFLDRLLVGTKLTYSIDGDQIILKREKDANSSKTLSGQSDFIIAGWARDADTNEVIPGVNVYLNGTSIGAVTNENGFYRFNQVPYGTYELVFSHVSFHKVLFEVKVQGNGDLTVNGRMRLRTNELQGIEVASTRLT